MLIILSVCSTNVLGSFFVVSEQDIEFAKKIQTQVQKIVNKGLQEKYQEYEQISKNTAAAKNDKTLDVVIVK